MAVIINTEDLDQQASDLTARHTYWVYNCLDCCLTAEVDIALEEKHDDVSRAMYNRALDMQAPIMDMMLRGTLTDDESRQRVLTARQKELNHLETVWHRLCREGLGLTYPVNWRSPKQLLEFFFITLNAPEIKERNSNGVMALSTSRSSMEKLQTYYFAKPFAKLVLAMRDEGKAIGFLQTKLDEDNRIRCSFSLAGTKTGRLSSSFSDSGTGTNLQNVDRNLRDIFVADPGKVLVNVDIQQGDSRNVGVLCWEYFFESHGPEFAGAYLDACESGDLHTFVCRMGWPELPWVDDLSQCKSIAKKIWYRDKSYRDGAKILGHGSNFGGKPGTMSGHTKTPVRQIASFQTNYFAAFPCIPAMQEHTAHLLRTQGFITHPLGRRRYFWGRHEDPTVINSAIAFSPQGMTGEEINLAMLNLWRDPRFELLIQVHDSILFQIDENLVNELVPVALDLLAIEIPLVGGRVFKVAFDAEVGWNWGKYSSETNPHGLREWEGEELRKPPRRLSPLRRVIPKEFLV